MSLHGRRGACRSGGGDPDPTREVVLTLLGCRGTGERITCVANGRGGSMGFSLHFMRVTKDVQLDVDRAAVAAFLDQHGLRVVESPYGGEIVDRDDRALTIDGAFSDLHLDSLEQSDPLSGGIFHATL